MFNLYDAINDDFEFEGIKGHVDMSFDNILRLFHEIGSDDKTSGMKLSIALYLLTGHMFEKLDIPQRVQLYNFLMQNFVLKVKPVMQLPPIMGDSSDKEEQYYSLEEDADYIWASFKFYGIDLDLERGKLHWYKFRALLASLPDDSKFKQVINIRMWKPEKGDSKQRIKEMRELQVVYALGVTQEDVNVASMDFDERRQYEQTHDEMR
ncbi:Gp15 family bacteriophage protein [Loigolactobacillus zhaoyuanensis]|uniref:Gp15 family bacteriophage protein n=1 Tax=Loigolactobacillus zhaoyuanensis TaxID=2486017 RepID=UPI000F749C4B|nr:Gp15 family bacteriophage protein [Loigolactobacillus zhaoyuanensis]